MSFEIPSADALVTFIKDFTGSNNDTEIKQCIYLAELSMRNIELPALRTDPYDPVNIGVVNNQGMIPIPANMNKPILFFKQGNPGGVTASATGPWIVYDRIGDRDIITQGMIAQLYLQPVNVPAVIRGKFSEVGRFYKFLPYVGEGDLINMYYYQAWPQLFSPVTPQVLSPTGTVTNVTNPIPGQYYAQVTNLDSIDGFAVGDTVNASPGTGNMGFGGTRTIVSIDSPTSFTFMKTAGTSPIPGTVTDVGLTNQTVQNNAVLATWAEGYVYATLREYYIKRHNAEDAQVYATKYDNAWNIVEDQNNYGKWSGGHTRMTSVWQPRQYRQYNIK